MRRVFHFILSHSIFISLCAAALALQTLQLLHQPISYYLLSFIFFATLSGYNAYWITSRFFFNPNNSIRSFLQSSRSSHVVLLIAISGMWFCFLQLSLLKYYILITFIFLGLYAVPLIPLPQLAFTRKAGFLKTILLALAWAMATTFIPLQVPVNGITKAIILVFVNRFLFMLMLCIIFDKRDAAIDKIRALHSLATDMHPVTLNYFMALILAGYMITAVALFFSGVQLFVVCALLLTGIITTWLFIISFKKRGYIFYYFLVDGLMFLSGLLTLLAGI